MHKPSLMMLTIALVCGVAQGGENDALIARMKSYKEQPTAWTAAQAGEDAKVMGEYSGKVNGKTWGAQIAALGLGTYRLTLYPGGLPGDGWTPPEPGGPDRGPGLISEAFGRLKDGVIDFAIEPLEIGQNWVWKDGTVTVIQAKRPIITMPRVGNGEGKGPVGVYRDDKFTGFQNLPIELHITECGAGGVGFRAQVMSRKSAPMAATSEVDPKWGLVLHGDRQGDAVVFDLGTDGFVARWTETGLSVTDSQQHTASLARVERSSPTIGARPPTGAIVLFDGSNLDAWDLRPETGKNQIGAEQRKKLRAEAQAIFDAEHLLPPGLATRQKFGDFQLHLEMQVALMSGHRHRTRASGGLRPQGRYELDLTDSFGVLWHDSHPTQMLALYKVGTGHKKHDGVHWPDVNASLPPMTWQSIDLDFTAARFDAGTGRKLSPAQVTLDFNGVRVFDKVIMQRSGPYCAKEGPDPAPLELDPAKGQRFRNVWVVPRNNDAATGK
jgi:hypothetical protein